MLDAKNILLQVVVKKSVLHWPARALDTRQNLKKKNIYKSLQYILVPLRIEARCRLS